MNQVETEVRREACAKTRLDRATTLLRSRPQVAPAPSG